jgi:transcriptional regulator with XRE-family HTH domain
MLDDLAGKRTGERIQILRERRGLSRPVLAGLVGMSASWLKSIERSTRLPPRLPLLVKLAEACRRRRGCPGRDRHGPWWRGLGAGVFVRPYHA